MGVFQFIFLLHADEVQRSRNVFLESYAGGICSPSGWRSGITRISYLYIRDHRKHSHCPDLARATQSGFHPGHDPCLEERDSVVG